MCSVQLKTVWFLIDEVYINR